MNLIILLSSGEEYAETQASDIFDINDTGSWPFNHLDWSAAAEELFQYHKEEEILGEDYYVRE